MISIYTNDGGYAHRPHMRNAWEKLAYGINPELFFTTTFKANTGLSAAKLKIGRALAYIDNRYIGRSWTKMPSEMRTIAVIFAENVQSNLHYHWLMRLPIPTRPRDLKAREATLKELWGKIEPGGTCTVRLVEDEGAARYSTKQLVRPGYLEHIILSSDFHPNRG
jgi:hypothetical protein